MTGHIQHHRHRQQGFTLIEAVVSLLILAVMSIMSYQAVEVVLAANERSQNDLAEEVNLQRTWQVIANDLMHLRSRPFMDGLGGVEAAYATQQYGALVSFTRGGTPLLVSNPTGLARVSYTLFNNELRRASLPAFINPRQVDSQSQLMLKGVSEVRFEQLADREYFVPAWPLAGSETSLPKMIRVTIVLEDGSNTIRVFPGVESDG